MGIRSIVRRFMWPSTLALCAMSFSPLYAQEVHGWPPNFVYGKWCGLNHPTNPDQEPCPIDEIDAACRKHDFAYDNQDLWGNADADMKLVNVLTGVLTSGTDLSDRQFAAASAIVSWFSGLKFITVYSDIANGKVSSVLKLGTSSAISSIVVPAAISNKLVTALAKEVSEASNLPLDEIDLMQDATSLSVEFIVDVANATEWTIDEVGDTSQAIIKKVGEETRLDKPVRELREEIVLAITHPKKFAKRTERMIKKLWDFITSPSDWF